MNSLVDEVGSVHKGGLGRSWSTWFICGNEWVVQMLVGEWGEVFNVLFYFFLFPP